MATKDFTLTPSDYAHANIAERARTDWRDEPVMALAPSTKRTPRNQGYGDRNRRYDSLSAHDAAYQFAQGAR